VNDIREEFVQVSKDIDDGVDRVMTLILPLTDTIDTGNKVTVLKEQTIESLRHVIEMYVTERQKLEGALARPTALMTKPQMADQVGAIDEKVDQRIDDILRISASLAEHQEFEKYEYTHVPYSEIYHQGVTEEYRQNRKVQRRVVQTRGELSEELQKSITTLKERLSRYERTLPYQSTTANKEAVESLINDTRARIAEREQQLRYMGELGREESEKPIGEADFKAVVRMLNDEKAEIKASVEQLRRLKGEYDAALIKLNNARRLETL
jgi:hypothetical protein